MKKILELTNIADLGISGGRCECSCLGDEYENRGQLLVPTSLELDRDICANKCSRYHFTANSHCKNSEDLARLSRIT